MRCTGIIGTGHGSAPRSYWTLKSQRIRGQYSPDWLLKLHQKSIHRIGVPRLEECRCLGRSILSLTADRLKQSLNITSKIPMWQLCLPSVDVVLSSPYPSSLRPLTDILSSNGAVLRLGLKSAWLGFAVWRPGYWPYWKWRFRKLQKWFLKLA